LPPRLPKIRDDGEGEPVEKLLAPAEFDGSPDWEIDAWSRFGCDHARWGNDIV
jgi:hypothetical protein